MRAGGVEIVALGPFTKAVRDPISLHEVKLTSSLRLYFRLVGAARSPGLAWVETTVQKALFDEVLASARRGSVSLLEVCEPAFQRDLETNILSQLRDRFAEVGMAALAIDSFVVSMDARTQAWLKSQRTPPPPPPAPPPVGPPSSKRFVDEPTQVASRCLKCGVLTTAEQKNCPACGGSVAPPAACKRCREPVRPGSRFCANCGAPC